MFRFFASTITLVLLLSTLQPTPAADRDKLKPINLEKINTGADEVDPHVIPGGKLLIYSSNSAGTFDLYGAPPSGKSWGPGKPNASLNTKEADERSPFFTRGGVFYYASNAVPDEKLKKLKNFDLRMREGNRAPLPLLGISTRDDELHPWVTASGKEFFFSRKTKEGWKLFVARGPNPGPVKDEEEVGFPVGFHAATVTANGLTMYLTGPLENERWGLFRSQRAKLAGAWSKPEPLTALNHPEGQRGSLYPSFGPDDKMLYFSSDWPGGKGGLDIWMIPTADLGKAK